MSVWDSFFRLDVLDISFYDNISAQKATIFANSKNQVEFAIKVKVVDKDNKPLDIPDNELINNIYLVRYADGSKDLAPWSATSIKNEYAKVVAWNAQLVDTKIETYAGEKVVKFYLSGSEANSSIDISAGIYIPGVGDFDTSQNGTNTRNGPKGETGTPFKNPKSKHVNSIQPIDYSRPEEVEIRGMPTLENPPFPLVSDMKITAPYKEWYQGISSKAKFTIHPKRKGYVFHLGDPQRNNVNLSTCRFPVNPDMILGIGGDSAFDAQFVFINRSNYGLEANSTIKGKVPGDFWGKTSNYTYEIGSNDRRHSFSQKLEYGCITVNICNHRIPWGKMARDGWDQMGKIILIDVTDNYGNSAVINIKGTGHRDNWPQIFVNDDNK